MQLGLNGEIPGVRDNLGMREFEYDPVDRLTSVNGAARESYSYDSVGNRLGNDTDYTYGAFNRLTNRGSINYTHDANGNQLTAHFQASGLNFAYDFENRLTEVTSVGMLSPHPPSYVRIIDYKYDALGRRIERTATDGDAQRFVYDGQDVIEDLNGNGSVVTKYLNGPGIDDKIRQTDSTNGNLYFLTDHLGSTRALTDQNGDVVETIDYDSFGNSTGSSLTRYDYTGRERDPDTGLLYYRARWYDPQVGRFISEDPAGLAGGDVNVLAYVGNSPVINADPFGLWAPDAHETIIDEALQGCLSKAQRQQLKDASAYIDGWWNGGQNEWYAYQHGMRGGPGQSAVEARNAADNFISLHEGNARRLAPNGCRDGYQRISDNALYEFGEALHTITDETSPAHEGFQIWYGPPYPSLNPFRTGRRYAEWVKYVKRHEKQETLGVLMSDRVRLDRIKKLVREAFAKTFGDCGCCTD